MTDKNRQLLELINQGRIFNDICSIMKLSYKQLSNRLVQLKKWGIDLQRSYYYDGETTFDVSKQLEEMTSNETVIVTTKQDTNFRAILLSDLHLGNIGDRIDSLHRIYEYAAKENIHIILNTGDFMDGMHGESRGHSTIFEQAEYAVKNHPYDKNILNFICLGNHDALAKTKFGCDFANVLENSRPDLIPICYGNGTIRVKNDRILLRHPIVGGETLSPDSKCLILRGHSHMTKFVESGGTYCFYLPTFSDIQKQQKGLFPSAFLMDLKMFHGYFIQGKFYQLYVDSKVYVLNELTYNLSSGKPITNVSTIENEYERKSFIEESQDIEEKTGPVLAKTPMSQIDKFNKRYKK